MSDELKKPDSRSVAFENEVGVLKFVRFFGHMRRAEISRAGWHGSSAESAEKMAARTIARMLEKGLLLPRQNSLGETSYVLTSRAAALLSNEYGLPTNAGYNIQGVAGPQFWHRTLATNYLLHTIEKGGEAFGEYAINHGWCPLSREDFTKHYGKVPDGLVLYPGESRGYRPGTVVADWVEVESSFKPPKERQKMLDVAWKVGMPLRGGDGASEIIFDRMVIVYSQDQNHRQAITQTARKQLRDRPLEVPEEVTNSVCLAAVELAKPLRWKGVTESTLTEALSEPARTSHVREGCKAGTFRGGLSR
ncbi:hypothetical protein [Ramlibacter alkalitolerans]|uniref:Uncharacterized protein n=1 Tax=Ramlibacter alkalitolerans TaxID=2039631 RepID=A0ABS1JU03_9BURK|nr:hypothetical protein [Ramlibacter alkalitolerans]MBL0427734.1 hypothetical protein [Ramlibacter alkalitolerans]